MRNDASSVLTPENLHLITTIAEQGSMAAAAHVLNLAPSAVSYRVRQIEEHIDALLFDRRSRNAKPTAAGRALIDDAQQLLNAMHITTARVRRVATGWEPYITIAVDGIVPEDWMWHAASDFYQAQTGDMGADCTQLRLQSEVLNGTLHRLEAAQADIALGVWNETPKANIRSRKLVDIAFVYAVAPTHPLAHVQQPVSDNELRKHRIVVVTDSIPVYGKDRSTGIIDGQPQLVVPTLHAKLQAQIRGLGCGYLPVHTAQPAIDRGELVAIDTKRGKRTESLNIGWCESTRTEHRGKALQWWLDWFDQATLSS